MYKNKRLYNKPIIGIVDDDIDVFMTSGDGYNSDYWDNTTNGEGILLDEYENP